MTPKKARVKVLSCKPDSLQVLAQQACVWTGKNVHVEEKAGQNILVIEGGSEEDFRQFTDRGILLERVPAN